jgi:SAM-dependent methyltransferase
MVEARLEVSQRRACSTLGQHRAAQRCRPRCCESGWRGGRVTSTVSVGQAVRRINAVRASGVDGALHYYAVGFITRPGEQRGALPSRKTGGGIRGGLGRICGWRFGRGVSGLAAVLRPTSGQLDLGMVCWKDVPPGLENRCLRRGGRRGMLRGTCKSGHRGQGCGLFRAAVSRVAGERKGFQVSRGDVRKLEFADGWFDLIFSNSTLDHFATRAEIVESIAGFARLLAPGGYLLITLDNPQNPVVWCRNLLPQRPLEAAGFRVLRRLPLDSTSLLVRESSISDDSASCDAFEGRQAKGWQDVTRGLRSGRLQFRNPLFLRRVRASRKRMVL